MAGVMAIFLVVLSVAAFLAGSSVLRTAKGAVHEIEALICFMVSAIFLSSGFVVAAIQSVDRRLQKTFPHVAEKKPAERSKSVGPSTEQSEIDYGF